MTTTRRELLRNGALGASAAALGSGSLTGASAIAQGAGGGRKPNILVLMCDQERYPQWTPDLPLPARDWVDSRGVNFERFHHSAVQCSPSRACFWTGMYPPQHGIFGNFLNGETQTAGYNGVHLERCGRSAECVVDAILCVDNTGNLRDCRLYLRTEVFE